MSVSIGTPLLWNMDGRSFTRVFERKGNFLIWEIFYEEFERYVKKGPVNGQLSVYSPCWGKWRVFIY